MSLPIQLIFKSIKLFPYNEFCRDKNKWWSDGAMSDEYGG